MSKSPIVDDTHDLPVFGVTVHKGGEELPGPPDPTFGPAGFVDTPVEHSVVRTYIGRVLLATTALVGGGGGGTVVTYDTSIGLGVDSDGIANLPLNPGGTVGSDLATGAPTTLANITYNSGTRTISNTGSGNSLGIATWSGILTVGQRYLIEIAYNVTSSCDLYLKDGSGTTQTPLAILGGFPGKGSAYYAFTATGVDAVIYAVNDFFQGTIKVGKIAPLTGALPGRIFWVYPGTGSDSLDALAAQSSSTPLNSVSQALAFVVPGVGDHVKVAEGTTIATLPSFRTKSGYSAAYPTVVETYNPADATNTAYHGRAYQRGAWVKVTGNSSTSGVGALDYFALRGFEFGNGNLPDQGYNFTPPTDRQYNYILIEANRFMYSSLSYDGSGHGSYTDKSTWAVGHIYRNNVHVGAWTVDESLQGPSNIFVSFANGTYEDNINHHAGWKVGASRDDLVANGGTVISTGGTLASRKHPTYFYAASNMVSRRNFHTDGCGDGGSWRGDTHLSYNLIVDSPTALLVFGGDQQDVKRPDGRMVKIWGNAGIGSAPLNTATGGIGSGLGFDNSNVGSEAWDNLLARGLMSNTNNWTYSGQASANQPSYGSIHDNKAFYWVNSGLSYFLAGGFFPAQDFVTYSANYSDDPTGSPSGVGNLNFSALSTPNPYANFDALVAASGISGATDKASMLAKLIAEPVAHYQRTLLTVLRTGYGMSTTIQ